jgi:hypothetical protein
MQYSISQLKSLCILLYLTSTTFYLNQNILWQKLFGGANRKDPSTIIACPDSGYAVLSSYQTKPNSSNLWLLRFNNKGDTLWTKFYGDSTKNEPPVSLHLLPDGFMIIGSVQMANREPSVWLIKCDRKGDFQDRRYLTVKTRLQDV